MPEGTPRLTFPRSARIKLRRDFARIKSRGKRAVSGCLILNFLTLPAEGKTRVGIVTSRKVGNAVARARARRLLREAFRLHQNDLQQPAELVLVARQSITRKQYQGVETDYLRALRSSGLLLNP